VIRFPTRHRHFVAERRLCAYLSVVDSSWLSGTELRVLAPSAAVARANMRQWRVLKRGWNRLNRERVATPVKYWSRYRD